MKKFTVITKDGSKWLRPTDVLSDVFNVIYIGSRPEGTTVDESEVKEVRQKNIRGEWVSTVLDDDGMETRTAYVDDEPECPECGKYCSCPEEDIYDAVADYRRSHPEPSNDRHIRPFKTQNVRPLVNQLVGEEISFSRFVEILNNTSDDARMNAPLQMDLNYWKLRCEAAESLLNAEAELEHNLITAEEYGVVREEWERVVTGGEMKVYSYTTSQFEKFRSMPEYFENGAIINVTNTKTKKVTNYMVETKKVFTQTSKDWTYET